MRFTKHVVAAGIVIVIAGCAHHTPVGQMSPEKPQAVVRVAPPEPRAESPGNQPHPGYAWIPGYWNWVSTRHVWVLGFWTRPPGGAGAWEPAHWRHEDRGWVLIRGHWR